MTDSTFHPWRSTSSSTSALESRVDEHWSNLLKDSRQAIEQLGQAAEQLDHRMAGAKELIRQVRDQSQSESQASLQAILNRIAALEHRIEALENQLHPPHHKLTHCVIPHAA